MKKIKCLAIIASVVLVSILPATSSKAAYDLEGTTLTIKAPQGATSMTTGKNEIYLYDANGNTITKQTASGYLIDFAYDANGNRVSTTEHKFDGMPWGMTVKTYDAAGHVVSELDATGAPIYTYEYNGNVVTKTETKFPHGTTTYTYDNKGNLLSRAEDEGTYSYTYDAAGNVIQLKYTAAYYYYELTKDFTYDAKGNIATEHRYDTDGGDGVYTYTNVYDALGRLSVVDDGDGNILQFTY